MRSWRLLILNPVGTAVQDLETIYQNAETAIESITELASLETIRVQYFGKKGIISNELKQLGKIPADQRKALGQKINQIKEKILSLFEEKQGLLKSIALKQKLNAEKIDVTLPGKGADIGHYHPITKTLLQISELFSKAGFQIATGPEIEDDYHNFSALNIPDHHPARAMHDTFYFDPNRLLRTHTSPVQIRVMEQQKPPLKIIAPGKVYRCDHDITHTPMFHQVEGFMLDKQVTFADLKGLLDQFLQAFFEEELAVRFRPSYFPFTEPSAEVDVNCVMCSGKGCRVCKQTGWLEVLGCGMIHPHVLNTVQINPEEYSGFAFGMGVERLAMLKYKIDDLRLFFENDMRFLQQF